MPSKHNRNAKRQSKQQDIYSSSIEIDSLSSSPNPPPPALLFDPAPVDSDPELEVERHGVGGDETDLDMGASFGRVRGDEELDDSPAAFAPSSPPEPPFSRPIPGSHSRTPEDHSPGHTRSPVLTREPTMLENFSRTVRNYVPSSIPIPTAAPSPPRVSRPVSFGSFMTSKRRSSSSTGYRDPEALTWERGGVDEAVFGEDDEDEGDAYGTVRGVTSYPGAGEGEPILWSRWDVIGVNGEHSSRRILILGYSTGLQIWDCTNIGSVSEILNLHGPEWGHVLYSAILPCPIASDGDSFRSQRPLLGMVRSARERTLFVVYSLSQHVVVKSIGLPGLFSFSSNGHFTVLSTINPATLHIISATSFSTLLTIPSTSLIPFTTPSASFTNNINSNSNVLLSGLDTDVTNTTLSHGHPVYALSGRLLAYASPPPRPDSPTGLSASHPRTRSRPNSGGFSLSHAELGHTAIKVGGTVLSGMKSLGGLAYTAAKSRASGGSGSANDRQAGSGTGISGLTNIFFSRSAPAASGSERERRHSVTSATSTGPGSDARRLEDGPLPSPTVSSYPASSAGYFVTVLDLGVLLSGSSIPASVAEFVASKHQPISGLDFTCDGTSLVVTPRDGQVMRYFQVRPSPYTSGTLDIPRTWEGKGSRERPQATSPPIPDTHGQGGGEAPWHIYNLRRGRTSAVVEGITFAQDGRWVAVGTRKRTIHVFAVNSYGGKPDQRSHLDGRMRNFTELQPLSTDVTPVVRLRAVKSATPELLSAPLAFVFVKSSETSLPTSLLPPPVPHAATSQSPRSSPMSHPEPLSPHRPQRPTNFQDMLVFDPVDGILSLRRFFVELRPLSQGFSIPVPTNNISPTSTSLPGMSAAGRLSISPSTATGAKPSGLSQAAETHFELHGKDSIVATWGLKRRRDWDEIKGVIRDPIENLSTREHRAKADALAQAELSTCSRLTRVLPRSVYLSHQFSFHTLGEDYHALIRSYQFDVGGSKLDVRREVEVSAYSTGTGESFVEGFSPPRDVRRASSSFDEPLASAISAGLDYHTTPSVLPMLPNGMPRSHPKSFRSPIPIRNMASGLSDGMNEGIVRFRREMHKVRSPQFGARSDSSLAGSVPLEFDEEDEDFIGLGDKLVENDDGATSRTTSRGAGDSGASVSTPSTSAQPLDEHDDSWNGWGAEDMQAVDDAERFDDISVVGFLDEEHAQMVEAERARMRTKRRF